VQEDSPIRGVARLAEEGSGAVVVQVLVEEIPVSGPDDTLHVGLVDGADRVSHVLGIYTFHVHAVGKLAFIGVVGHFGGVAVEARRQLLEEGEAQVGAGFGEGDEEGALLGHSQLCGFFMHVGDTGGYVGQ
jgi:hypothetical protein